MGEVGAGSPLGLFCSFPSWPGGQAACTVSHLLPAGVAWVESLPVILGSALRSEQMWILSILPKMARFKHTQDVAGTALVFCGH